jgi:sterol desaturase/sphingolipid hydroxylase (fatty acid hydroxylase superfamily)
MLRYLIGFTIGLAILATVYAALQYVWPSIRGQRLYRAGFWTDLAYWFLSPVINRGFATVVVVAALIPVALLVGVALPELKNGWGPAATLPLWVQAIAILVVGDFIGYWVHRYTHSGWWWQVHAVHHSSPQLDWLAAARVHPLNDAIGLLGRVVPLVALGFAPIAVAGVAPFVTLYAITLRRAAADRFLEIRQCRLRQNPLACSDEIS